MKDRIGFMQGRLSERVGGRVQAFPTCEWQQEFERSQRIGLRLMEWTLDDDRLEENPLMTASGRKQIGGLCEKTSIEIPSVTCDCFMQAPFWKAKGAEASRLESRFVSVVRASGSAKIELLVVPLVDNGRLENREQEVQFTGFLDAIAPELEANRVQVVIESDYEPVKLARLAEQLDPRSFGINYDMGNSAASGFDVRLEMSSYGSRIKNVHVKDRPLGGTTVPLGQGAVDFALVFSLLADCGYRGNYILQTARAEDGDHAGVLARYRDCTARWIRRYES